MSHIFISYSRKDIDSPQKIVTALAESQLDTWIDWKSIPKGEDWEQEIYRGIEAADAFLFLISPHSVSSEMCNKEVLHALRNGKRIIPIFIANVDNRDMYAVTENFLQPEARQEINRRNFVLCRSERGEFTQAVEEIRKTIQTDFEWLRFHTNLQVKALEWERNGDEASFLLNGKELTDVAGTFVASSGKDPQPTDLQRRYLLISQETEEQKRRNDERRRRQIILGLSMGLVITGLLAIFALLQRNEANLQRSAAETASTLAIAQQSIAQTKEAEAIQQARIARSRELAAIAMNQLQVDQERSLLIALAANEQAHTLESNDALRRALQGFQANSTLERCPSESDFAEDKILGLSYAFSEDGNTLAIFCNAAPRQVRILDVSSGQTVFTIPVSDNTMYIFNLRFSADTSHLAYTERGFGGGALAGSAVVWDLGRGQQVFISPDTVFSTYSYLSDDGSNVWVFAPDAFEFDFQPAVFVYDTASQTQLLATSVLEISAPLGQNQIAVHGEDSWSIFNMNTLAEQVLPVEQQQQVKDFGANGEALIRDGDTLRILNFRTGEVTISPPIPSLPPSDQYSFMRISPDNARLAVVSDTTIEIIEFNDPTSRRTLEGHESPIGWVDFSEDSRLLMSTSLDTTCRIWDSQSGVLLSTINKVLQARFSSDKRQLVVHTEDGNLVRWDLPNRGEVASINLGQRVLQARFSDDGTKISLTTPTGETLTWEWQGAGLSLSPVAATEESLPGTMAKVSPNGSFLAKVDENQMLQLLDAVSQTVLFETRVSADRVNDLQFAPDSSMLILALGSAFVTEVQGDLGWLPFRTPGEVEQTATIWDVPSMEQIAVLRGSTDAVNSANFSPDSKYVVTASNDGFVRVYLARIADLEIYARNRILRNPPELTCEERVTFLKEKLVCPINTPTP